MKTRFLATSLAISILTVVLLSPTTSSLADPILKPKKYHGPIPKRSFGLAIGFLAGPDNEEMFDFLGREIEQALRSDLKTTDFGSSFVVDGIYTHKMHPQFAYRAKTGVAILRSESRGLFVSTEIDTASGLFPVLQFERDFNVYLFSFEASGLYYFQDASVAEFQAYLGGGLGFVFPWAQWKQSAVNRDTGAPEPEFEESKFSVEPVLHGVIGMLYHVQNTGAIFAEARYQLAESKFDFVEFPTKDNGIQNLNFDVNYSGFTMNAGYAMFF